MLNKSLHFMLPNGVRIGYLAWFSVLIKCFTPLKDEIFDKDSFNFAVMHGLLQ